MTDRGIVFIAAGDFFAQAAVNAARSIRETNPGLGVHLFTDSRAVDGSVFDGVTRIEDGHRRSKVDYLSESPFERTLYLDTDVRVVADIGEMFDLLDRFDIALAHAHSRENPNTTRTWRHEIPAAFPQLNGGVILYKKAPAVAKLLDDWRTAYHTAGFKKDQVTLRELVWLSDLRLAVLPPEYNVRFEKYLKIWDETEASPRILHYARFHTGRPNARKSKAVKWMLNTLRRIVPARITLQPKSKPTVRAIQEPTFHGKIFGVGFHKTGTSSLANALRMLGYETIHGDPRKAPHGGTEGRDLLQRIDAGDYNLSTLERYQAFTDNPYFTIWKQLAERYPDARFILTERDETRWIQSCVRYYAGRRIRPMRQWMFGEHADPSASDAARQAWLERYRAHNAAIREYFGPDSERLLILDVTNGDGWEKLCPFLDAPIPKAPFPHANKTKPKAAATA
ncbi:MAG: sulfotransferase [Phycisphaeraceae bacterium]